MIRIALFKVSFLLNKTRGLRVNYFNRFLGCFTLPVSGARVFLCGLRESSWGRTGGEEHVERFDDADSPIW